MKLPGMCISPSTYEHTIAMAQHPPAVHRRVDPLVVWFISGFAMKVHYGFTGVYLHSGDQFGYINLQTTGTLY